MDSTRGWARFERAYITIVEEDEGVIGMCCRE